MSCATNQICEKLRLIFATPSADEHLVYAGLLPQRVFDFGRLNAISPDLDAVIRPPQIFEQTVRPPTAQVSTAKDADRTGRRRLGKTLGIQHGVAPVPRR